jgi:hypothetical protein
VLSDGQIDLRHGAEINGRATAPDGPAAQAKSNLCGRGRGREGAVCGCGAVPGAALCRSLPPCAEQQLQVTFSYGVQIVLRS